MRYLKRGGIVDAVQVLANNLEQVASFIGALSKEDKVSEGDYIVCDINGKLYVYSEEDFMDMYLKA